MLCTDLGIRCPGIICSIFLSLKANFYGTIWPCSICHEKTKKKDSIDRRQTWFPIQNLAHDPVFGIIYEFPIFILTYVYHITYKPNLKFPIWKEIWMIFSTLVSGWLYISSQLHFRYKITIKILPFSLVIKRYIKHINIFEKRK